MKYNELAGKLRRMGCYDTGKQTNGHPLWYSPTTGKTFKMSNYGSLEVPKETLNQIKKDAGLK
jgi:hypothetical protein